MTNLQASQLYYVIEGDDSPSVVDEAHPLPVTIAETGYDTRFENALVGTVLNVKPGAGRLFGVYVTNGGTVTNWVQFFDMPASEVVLGTTPPKFSLGVPKGVSATDTGAMDTWWKDGVKFNRAISYAATTTPTGSTTAAVGQTINTFFK